MRRAVAILALLATAWPHAIVLECALGSVLPAADHAGHGDPAAARHGGRAGTAEHGTTRGAGHHGTAHHGPLGAHQAPERGAVAAAQQADDGAPAGSASCPMVMACGLVMIHAADAPSPASVASAPDLDPMPFLEVPAATDLSADPPPPRRHA